MDTMNALVWKGDGALSLERRPIPALQGPRDAIVRVTSSTICTSDLHLRSGAVPRARPGVVLGHEFVGVVEAVGNGISNLRPGDRVAACCESFCGDCWFCRRGYVNNCVHGGWELGCRIDKAYAGNGYGTEAFKAAAEWGLYQVNLSRVVAKCYKIGRASCRERV